MSPERWKQIKEVLQAALELKPEERSIYLERACLTDHSLRQEVESLLSESDQIRSSFLQSPPDGRSTLIPGTNLGGYEIVSLIGAGGMGEVYRARDLRLRRDVAIKVLPSFVSSDKQRLRRFEQEAQAAAALNHPNILAVHQMGTYEGAPYLVSELLEGETLREEIKRGPLPTRKAVDQAVQIARGLAAAHGKGIAHRDLKPENLFVTKDGRVKILDFGLAKLTEAPLSPDHSTRTMATETAPGVVMGTVGYMSPEQVRGEAADYRTDIFAFGAILYEMLSGKRAFQKPTSAETMAAILNEDSSAISQLSCSLAPALGLIVQRCLEKNREQRFQSASDLAFALDALSDSGSNSARPINSTKSRSNWNWAIIFGIAIVTIAGLTTWWATYPNLPQVQAVTQLSDDGEPKEGPLLTDGTRIYFNEGEPGSFRIAQISIGGGQTAPVATSISSPQVLALAPDNSALLAMPGWGFGPEGPLWLVPLPAGEARRVGDIEATDASFFPDGHIVFSKGKSLFVAEKDGANPRKLLDTRFTVLKPRVSPDGDRIDFATCCEGSTLSLQETSASGGGVDELLHTELDFPHSTWMADGKHLIVQLFYSGRSDLWVLPKRAGFLRHGRLPVRLTNGPLSYTDAVGSPGGNQIFAIGSKQRGELIRYDEKTREYIPYLSGISATDPTFSRDGQWVTYRSYPDHTLWRSRVDGSDRLQLTYPPMTTWYPAISPDGKEVAYSNVKDCFVQSTAGGAPRHIAQNCQIANWSPDGKLLVLGCFTPDTFIGEKNARDVRIVDLENGGIISVVPGSVGKVGPFWLDQHTLLATTEDGTKFETFNLRTQRWAELLSGLFVNWFISPDWKYLVYTTAGTDPTAFRLRLSDRKVEPITSLKSLRRIVGEESYTQVNVAPDNSLLFTRDIGTQEIYSLTLKWP